MARRKRGRIVCVCVASYTYNLMQGLSTSSNPIKSAIHFPSSGYLRNGGRDFTLLPWLPPGVDGLLSCLVVQDFRTRY